MTTSLMEHDPEYLPQLTIPFNVGSDTSEDAAGSMREAAPIQEARVYAMIQSARERGLTCDEVEVAMGHSRAPGRSSPSARCNGLAKKGRIKDSGYRRRTRTGRWAIVWITGHDPAPVNGPTPIRPPRRPSDETIRLAVQEIKSILAEPSRAASGDAVRKVLAWLAEVTK